MIEVHVTAKPMAETVALHYWILCISAHCSRSDCGLDFLELAGSGAALPGIGILASNDCRGLIGVSQPSGLLAPNQPFG